MTTAHLGLHAPNAAALGAIAELDDLLPAQLERAARVASFSALKRQFFAYEREETVQDLVHILNLHFPARRWPPSRRHRGPSEHS
jgi:hypothetical protein